MFPGAVREYRPGHFLPSLIQGTGYKPGKTRFPDEVHQAKRERKTRRFAIPIRQNQHLATKIRLLNGHLSNVFCIFAVRKTKQHEDMKLIAYYRTSTDEQSLGIEAQKEIVMQYMKAHTEHTLVAEYTEHMSGKINERPELMKATESAKDVCGAVIVAKLDRLTRDAEFGLHYCKSNEVIFCDHLNLNTPLERCLFFGMAQQEREYISQRTKAALQALKEQGAQLGTPKNLNDDARAKSIEARQNKAKNHPANKAAYALVSLMQGATRVAKADYLNANGFKTAKGGKWAPTQIMRLEALFA